MKECRFGHICTSRCGNDIECPCQADHCCALTQGCDGCDDHYHKPLFTTKHYKAIAEVINKTIAEERQLWERCKEADEQDAYAKYADRRSGVERLKTILMAMLEADNPKYSQEKFVKLLKD